MGIESPERGKTMANRRALTREGASKLFNELMEEMKRKENRSKEKSSDEIPATTQPIEPQPINPFEGLSDKQIETVTSIVQVTPGKAIVVFFRDEEEVVRGFLEKFMTESREEK